MENQEFTVEKALEIQRQQLKEWEYFLKSEIYKKLEQDVTASNHLATKGDHIIRGESIRMKLHGLLDEKREKLRHLKINAKEKKEQFPELSTEIDELVNSVDIDNSVSEISQANDRVSDLQSDEQTRQQSFRR